jgi:hypothetical protein
MENKIIISSGYFILVLPAVLYRNIGCPKKEWLQFRDKMFLKQKIKSFKKLKLRNWRSSEICVTSGFRPEVAGNLALLGYLGNNPVRAMFAASPIFYSVSFTFADVQGWWFCICPTNIPLLLHPLAVLLIHAWGLLWFFLSNWPSFKFLRYRHNYLQIHRRINKYFSNLGSCVAI